MDRTINFEPASGRDSDIKKAIDAIFAEMRQMDARWMSESRATRRRSNVSSFKLGRR